MVAALLAVFAGAASAQADTGKAQLQAVNGVLGTTVTVTATNGTDTVDLGNDLGDAGVGAPVTVEPGDWTIDFGDGNTYKLTVGGVEAWVVASGYGDSGAMAYKVNLDEGAVPAVVFANSSAVGVTVTPGDVAVAQGTQSATMAIDAYTITAGAASVSPDLTTVPGTSSTTVVAVGDDALLDAAVVTIADLAALKTSLEPGTSQVAVPDVVGQTEADANSAITAAGLVAAKTEAADDTVPAGSVISQDPAAGTMVDSGTNVNIVVSTGPDAPATVPVPDVAGKSAADGQAELEAAGFTVTTEEQASETVEAGLIIETNPSAGTEVAAGTDVKMIVSSGAGDIVVPDFTGMTVEEATAAAEDAGLAIKFVEDADNPDPEGVVVSQDPTGGTTVEAATEVVAQLSPEIDDARVIFTLSPEWVLTLSGINFQPGSTVNLDVLGTDKGTTATVQDDGSWAATADLSDVQDEAELLLVTGIAADGSDYESTFMIPVAEESSSTPVWVWIILGLLVVAIVALGVKMFGGGDSTGGDDSTDGDAATSGDAPPAETN